MSGPVAPGDDGLSVVDCTGVLIGNADIEDSCVWEPPTAVEPAPLPGHEHAAEFEPLPAWTRHDIVWAIVAAAAMPLGFRHIARFVAERCPGLFL